MNAPPRRVGDELSDEQIKDVLILAEQIARATSVFDLSLRNYAQVPDEPADDLLPLNLSS